MQKRSYRSRVLHMAHPRSTKKYDNLTPYEDYMQKYNDLKKKGYKLNHYYPQQWYEQDMQSLLSQGLTPKEARARLLDASFVETFNEAAAGRTNFFNNIQKFKQRAADSSLPPEQRHAYQRVVDYINKNGLNQISISAMRKTNSKWSHFWAYAHAELAQAGIVLIDKIIVGS